MLDNQLLVPTLPTAFERLRNVYIQGIITTLAPSCRYRWLAPWAGFRSPLPRLHPPLRVCAFAVDLDDESGPANSLRHI